VIEVPKGGITPKLPDLPRLPELPKINQEPINNLPSFPTSDLGRRFSQDTIKEAVTGEGESDGAFDEEEFEEDMKTPPMPLTKPMSQEYTPHPIHKSGKEPVFVRLDKFQESIHIFENAKHQISEMEHMLIDIRRKKESEMKELESWEKDIQDIKKQIERVDNEVFSKVE